MQHFSPNQIRDILLASISSLLDRKEEFFSCPDKDFSRVKKISFVQTMLFPMVASTGNVPTELLDFFDEDKLPSPSAMSQRRSQIKPNAYRKLFFLFTNSFRALRKFHGYRIGACDGSRLNLPYNPSDEDTFLQCISGRKGINQLHLNALYDPLNDIFLDIELQTVKTMDEKAAFCHFLSHQRSSDEKMIFIADRGYASYNNFAHAIHNGQMFLIRLPESFALSMSPSNDHWLDKGIEDKEIIVNIGRRNTMKNRMLENYHCIPANGHYDFIEAGSDQTDILKLRILKFPISDGSYEYIVTNLPCYAFSLSAIKELYHMRWDEETAFRHLKYGASMVCIHSLKKDFLIQEIYAKLTLYNFSSFIKASVEEKAHRKTSAYSYVVNHTLLLKICVRFLRGRLKEIEDLLCRNVIPVRPGRKFTRNLRRQSADTLAYR